MMAAPLLLAAFSAILGQVWCEQALSIACPSSSVYLPHEEHPSSYYTCYNGEATLLKCDLNKVFDVRSQKCISEDLSSRTKELDRSSCLQDITPHENNCNLYYSCNSGETVLRNCPADLNFGFEEQLCAWTASGCIGSRDGHIGIRQTPNDPTDLTNFGDYANGCPRNHHVHRLLPHEYNCQKFYYCVHGRRSVVRICPSILVFDNELQVCVWPWDTDCSNQNGGSSENGVSAETPPGSGPGSGPGPLPEEFEINGCPKNFYGSYHLPYPYDCGKFHTCVHGQKIVERCFDGLHFDFDRQSCVWPWETNCSGSSGGEGGTGGSSAEKPGSGSEPDNGDGNNNGENEGNGPSTDQPGPGSEPDNSDGGNSVEEGAGGSSGETTPEAGSNESNDPSAEQPGPGSEPDNSDGGYSVEEGAGSASGETTPEAGSNESNVPSTERPGPGSEPDNSDGGNSVEEGAGSASGETTPEAGSNESNGPSTEKPGPGSEPDNSDGGNSVEEGAGNASGETTPEAGSNESNGPTTEQPGPGSEPDNSDGDNSVEEGAGGSSGETTPEAGSNESNGPSAEQPGSGSEPDNGDGGNSVEEGTGSASEENAPGAGPGETDENGCPVNNGVTHLEPHEDCSKFYSRVYENKVVMNCPAGLLFSYKAQACLWPWESECEGNIGGGGSEPDNGGNSDETGTDGSSGETGPGASSNESNGTSIEKPSSGSEPDNGDGGNSAEEGTDGSPGETHENGCPVDHGVKYLKPHKVCSKYNICVHGTKVVMNCPAGLLFNYEAQICDWPWKSECLIAQYAALSLEQRNFIFIN